MDYNNLKVKKSAEVVQSFISIAKTLGEFTRKNAESLGLTIQQMGVLNRIYSAKEITLKEIVEQLSIPKSTASMIVDELVNLGLVERKAYENDRRKIKLVSTQKGQELAKKSIDNPASYIAMINALEQISEEEIEAMLDVHRKIKAELL